MSKNISILAAVAIVIVTGVLYSLSARDTEPRNLLPGQSQNSGQTLPDQTLPRDDSLPPSPPAVAPSPAPLPQPTSLTVISPNGGEKWHYGSTQTIRWSAPADLSTVSLALMTWFPSCDPAALPPGQVCAGFATPPPETYVIAAATENDGALDWVIPANYGAFGFENSSWNYVIKIQAGESSDTSDAPFSITAAQ